MMTPQQRWLLLASTSFLLLSISPPAAAEVMDSLLNNDCTDYFLNETPPEVPGILTGGQIQNQSRYKPICQTYKNERRFVTLYDTENKIPVFSAYKFTGISDEKGEKRRWKIEPQLEDSTDNRNMRVDKKDTSHQAANKDYTNTGTKYNRGHLYPMCHAFSKEDKESTCTLTNIVPQDKTFNSGSWNRMEGSVRCILDKYCRDNNNKVEAFVIVGAQPSTNNTLNERVNIPKLLWTAFCCYSSTEGKWLASAHWGGNVRENSGSKYMQTKTLAELEQQLSINGSLFKAFPESKCLQNESVTEFYPEIPKKCHCPKEATTTSAPTTTIPSTTSVSTPSTTLPTTEETTTTISPTTTSAPTTTIPSTTSVSTLSTTLPTTEETATTISPTTAHSVATTTTTTTTGTTMTKQHDSKNNDKRVLKHIWLRRFRGFKYGARDADSDIIDKIINPVEDSSEDHFGGSLQVWAGGAGEGAGEGGQGGVRLGAGDEEAPWYFFPKLYFYHRRMLKRKTDH